MGSAFSRENKPIEQKSEVRPTLPEKIGSKRSIDADQDSRESHSKKKRHFNKKDSWAKKEKKGKEGGSKPSAGGLQARPDSLGPREPRIPKKKVALLVGYNGSGYQGMQLNPDCVSIESILFDAMVKANAISKDNSEDPKKSAWMRAARTDKGVHAAGNLLSLKMQIPTDYDVVERINSFLPDQIRVWGYVPVIRSFHAKNLCDSRVYEYLLPTCAFMKPIPKELTDTPTNEDDIMICNNDPVNPIVKYATRSTPEVIQQRHDYRATKEQLETFATALKEFEGTHNFHNYTNGKAFNDKSANRYIMSIDVSDPLYIDGSEWVSIKLHGQSFILHQIRKMISMAMLITRTNTPISLIADTFERPRINIPKAPALGLLLERPIFKVYNEKMRGKANQAERDVVDFNVYNEKIDAFKKEWIYKKIFEAENQEHVFDGYLNSLDSHMGNDYAYLNEDGIIPDECLVHTKYNSSVKVESDDEKEEDD
ncbi:pseudouridine synthase [Thamnidium elegans]|nr:pseudouridine synthase [Thamnidium elegans]